MNTDTPASEIPLHHRLQCLQSLLNMSALAKLSGMSVQTLSSKLQRGTRFTEREEKSIRRTLTNHHIDV